MGAEKAGRKPVRFSSVVIFAGSLNFHTSADIVRIEDHGSELLIHLTIVGFTNKIFVSRIPCTSQHVAFKQGERIDAGFKLETALFFDSQGFLLD